MVMAWIGLVGVVLIVAGLYFFFGPRKDALKALVAVIVGVGLAAWGGPALYAAVNSLAVGPGAGTAGLLEDLNIINANGATIGQDDISLDGVIQVNSTSDAITSGSIWYFNVTVVIGGDDSNEGLTYNVHPGTVPEVAHSSDTTIQGPVLARQGDGDYNVVLTVDSTSYDEEVLVTQNELSSKTIGFVVNWATVLAELDPSQYPRGITVTYVLEGALFGSATLSLHATIQDVA